MSSSNKKQKTGDQDDDHDVAAAALLKQISQDSDRALTCLLDLFRRLKTSNSKSAAQALQAARAVVDGTKQRNLMLTTAGSWDLVTKRSNGKQEVIGNASFYDDDKGNIVLDDIWIDGCGPYGICDSTCPDHSEGLTFATEHKFYGNIVEGEFLVTVPADGGPPTAEYIPKIDMEEYEAGLASDYHDLILVKTVDEDEA